MKDSINEATLTARLHKILEVVFPTFKDLDIVHQESFTIKFGHHAVKVDHKDPSNYPNRAIFDMLISCEGINIMLVELKREDHEIVDEDIKQGLSYARLIPKMPPLVLISNGDDNRLFDSYTMQQCSEKSVDISFIKSRIQNAFSLATSEFKNAVNLLMNRRPELIGKIISKISKSRLDQQAGKVSDLDKAICKEFQIKRNIVKRIYKSLVSEEHVYGIVGHAFSGKTNALYQFFREYGFQKDHYILYIDLKDQNFSIFQQLAQEFSRETKDYIKKEKIREWFNSLLYSDDRNRFILLVDNLNTEISNEITEEFLELISLFKGSNHRIIYTLDEWTFKKLAYIPNRNYKTIIGTVTKIFTLGDVTDKEYKNVNRWLFNICKTIIPHGGHYCSEYRKVRILRMLAAMASKHEMIQGGYSRFSTIADISLINQIARSQLFTQSTHEIYKKLTIAFFMDRDLRSKNPELRILGKTIGAIFTNTIKDVFGDDISQLILKSGLVVERNYRNLRVLIPKIPELMIKYSIDFLVLHLSKKTNELSSSEVYKEFINCCEQFPSSDIIGAGLMQKIGENNVDLFSDLIQKLIIDEPIKSVITKGTEILSFSKKHGHIKIKFESDMEMENIISQHLPYSILAQLVQYPMEGEDGKGQRSYNLFVDLLLILGSIKEFIHRVDNGVLDELKPLLTLEIPGIGIVISEKNGVIETLVQSYQTCFLSNPEIIERLYDRAHQEKNYSTIWRIYLAMKPLSYLVDTTLELKARRLEYKSRIEIYKKMDEITGLDVSSHIADP